MVNYYRCPFCDKVYPKYEDAKLCLDQCYKRNKPMVLKEVYWMEECPICGYCLIKYDHDNLFGQKVYFCKFCGMIEDEWTT